MLNPSFVVSFVLCCAITSAIEINTNETIVEAQSVFIPLRSVMEVWLILAKRKSHLNKHLSITLSVGTDVAALIGCSGKSARILELTLLHGKTITVPSRV